MTDDPIVNEVRDARQRIFAECAEDLERLLDRFQAAESDYGDCLVTADDLQEKRRIVSTEGRKPTDCSRE
jgi:hypothetical protein